MLIEVKDWRSTELRVGDLTYFRRTLLKVTKVLPYASGLKRKYRGMSGRTVKFRKLCKVQLTPYRPISEARMQSPSRHCDQCGTKHVIPEGAECLRVAR